MGDIREMQEKIEGELQFLFAAAVKETISSRKYWGVGQHMLFKDLIEFTENATRKFALRMLSTRKEIDATDWYIDVQLLDPLRSAFEDLGLSRNFEICVESSEEVGDVFYQFNKVKLHAPWHDFSSTREITYKDLEDLYEKLTKFTLMLRLAN